MGDLPPEEEEEEQTKQEQLQTILETVLNSEFVYFQPPASVQLTYPCIVYERDYIKTRFASNLPYSHAKRYKVTVMDRSPDSSISDAIALLAMCAFDRHFVINNLHHDVFTLYF